MINKYSLKKIPFFKLTFYIKNSKIKKNKIIKSLYEFKYYTHF